jgi:hypothetical protein
MESVYKEVKRRCHAEKRITPSRNSVLKRIRALDARLVARKRLGAKSAESIALSTPGRLEATEALELIQIDHTLADVMIVDSVFRHSIGRPWLSLAIDVATRSVLGFHLGLEAPSALAVALCIEHAVLPKLPSAAAPATDTSWDMFGMPRTILVDNGFGIPRRGAHSRLRRIRNRLDVPARRETPIRGSHRAAHRHHDGQAPSPARQHRFFTDSARQLSVGVRS